MTHLDELRERYRQLPEAKLRQIAVYESNSLTPEALAVLKEEIAARDLSKSVSESVRIRTEGLSPGEHAELLKKVRMTPCPVCGSENSLLNAGYVASAISPIFFTVSRSELVIACPPCLTRVARSAQLRTAFLGWWGFPFGPIRAMGAISKNRSTIKAAVHGGESPALTEFVRLNPAVAMEFIDRRGDVRLQ